MTRSVEWSDNHVRLLDQRLLPHEERYVDLFSADEVSAAIRNMTVRGAPAIGVAAAYGVVLAAMGAESDRCRTAAEDSIATLSSTRPTAVNLFAALDRMRRVLAVCPPSASDTVESLLREARRVHQEELNASTAISCLGASLVPDQAMVLTHCNAGLIATAAGGTALGAIIEAHRQGKVSRAIATETRPLLQGARLTVWELVRAGVPTTLITDSMVGHMMRTTRIDCVFVGADRIAANGDVANKIGTYGIAVLAKAHRIPFYVAAPTSTVDLSLPDGEVIQIEERDTSEVTTLAGRRIAAEGPDVRNPAFDVTPAEFISAIVTERGILETPFLQSIAGALGGGERR